MAYEELKAREQFILTVCANGYGKLSSAYEYRRTGRGGQGITNIDNIARNGPVVASFPASKGHQLMLVTDQAKLIRMSLGDLRVIGRGSAGVRLFNVADDDPGAASWVRTLESAGFAMLDIDDQTPIWRSVLTAKHRARIEHAAVLAEQFGERVVAPALAVSRTMLGLDYGPSVIANTRRVELVARKDTTLARRRIARGSSEQFALRPRPIDE